MERVRRVVVHLVKQYGVVVVVLIAMQCWFSRGLPERGWWVAAGAGFTVGVLTLEGLGALYRWLHPRGGARFRLLPF